MKEIVSCPHCCHYTYINPDTQDSGDHDVSEWDCDECGKQFKVTCFHTKTFEPIENEVNDEK